MPQFGGRIYQYRKGDFMKHFYSFGECFLPEVLMTPVLELERSWEAAKGDAVFQGQLDSLLKQYAGRPTPLTEVHNFRKAINGPRILLKREDLLHTGAHKINNALGQCL